ncbi:MAG: hypothetical protein JW801_00235 [Bacteroidales bacterium]|nr:hypothetical protein [Bacteroidales bacterium]
MQKTETCSSAADHSYEVYIPDSEVSCEKLPLVVILSPHGDGKYALDYFKSAAISYPCILVASNLIKNNFPGYLNSLNTLILDAKSKFPVNDQLYLAGFSGGARMSLDYASQYSPDGLIVMGGLTSPEQLAKIHCPVISLVGMADFNFLESVQYLYNKPSASKLIIELTTHSHEWADPETISRAMAYLFLSGIRQGDCLSENELKTYCKAEFGRMLTLREQRDWIPAELLRQKMAMNTSFSREADFGSRPEFEKSYSDELILLAQSIKLELALREEYSRDLQQMNASWWQNEISTLDARIHSDNDRYRRFAYLRIKGYLGILCYSLTNASLQQNMLPEAERLLAVYRMVEPQNPDMLYFSALLAFREGREDESKIFLIEALEAGFDDMARFRKEFPESYVLSALPE